MSEAAAAAELTAAHRRAEEARRAPVPYDFDLLSEFATSWEVQQIDVFNSKMTALASRGFELALQREQHAFEHYDKIEDKKKLSDYPVSLRVNSNKFEQMLAHPYNAELDTSVPEAICTLLRAIHTNLGGHLKVVWSDPLVYVERVQVGKFKANVLLVLYITNISLHLPM